MNADSSDGLSVFIIGAGYTGARLAEQLISEGAQVHATTRNKARRAALQRRTVNVQALNLDDDQLTISAPATDYSLIYLTPPANNASKKSDPRLTRALQALRRPPQRIVYISSTAVYGDCGGDVAEESREPAPENERGERRLGAEKTATRWAAQHDVALVILRVPGIYGPDRLPLARINSAEPIIAPADSHPGNRIHRDDLVRVCAAALADDTQTGIFNVCDGDHRSGSEFTVRVAELAGLPAPPQISRAEAKKQFSEKRYSFLSDSRIIDNKKMMQAFPGAVHYTNCEDGIRASLPVGKD